MLQKLLNELNALVRSHNAEIDELVANQVHTKEKGDALKVDEITREFIAGIKHWEEVPAQVLRVIGTAHSHMHAQEFLKLARSVPKDKLTRVTLELWRGSFKGRGGDVAKAASDPNWHLPATYLTYQLAHVAANAEGSVSENTKVVDAATFEEMVLERMEEQEA